jgi:putative molybdopterin biosynthesis protein
MKRLMTTKEVAQFLNIHEKMVYTLVAEKNLPATKITGKWLFPQYLIEQWVENNTINLPKNFRPLTSNQKLIVLAGSNDLLLDTSISLFNRSFNGHLAVFGNIGSMGGIRALRNNLCHIAASHLIQDDGTDYNFQFAGQEFDTMPIVLNFCRRLQGLLFRKNNPREIYSVADLGQPGLRMVNRSLGTGTRLLLDLELKKAGIHGDTINGYTYEVPRHMDIGLEILAGRADVGPGIEPVAGSPGSRLSASVLGTFRSVSSKGNLLRTGCPEFFRLVAIRRFQGGRSLLHRLRSQLSWQDRLSRKSMIS